MFLSLRILVKGYNLWTHIDSTGIVPSVAQFCKIGVSVIEAVVA